MHGHHRRGRARSGARPASPFSYAALLLVLPVLASGQGGQVCLADTLNQLDTGQACPAHWTLWESHGRQLSKAVRGVGSQQEKQDAVLDNEGQVGALQGGEQPQQDDPQHWIVRFTEYKSASTHHAALASQLPGEGSTWQWVPRHNRAATYPTDFGLLTVLEPQLLQQIPQVQGVRDVHPDRRFVGKLQWTQEEQEQHRSIRPDTDSKQPQAKRQPGSSSSSSGSSKQHKADQQLLQPPRQEEADVFSVNKKPGRMTTSFMMPDEDVQAAAAGLSRGASGGGSSSGGGGRSGSSSSSGSSSHGHPKAPAGHDRQLLFSDTGRDLGMHLHHHHRHGFTNAVGQGPLPQHQHHRQQQHMAHRRQLLLGRTTLTSQLSVERIHELGFSGAGVKVGVFDTGIRADHPHIRNLRERTNWTHQDSLSDGLGHGTFVAGVIGSQDKDCPGLAPDVELYTFKVFTDDQVSFTSWFLDAFNYAMLSGMHVINLSIGGPDFMDTPFVEKVWEVTSSGVLLVSAIGNDGPLYGTLNNPADQSDVIGVGGIDDYNSISSFSSRGMTTWELKLGAGRVKPDVMAYSKDVHGSKIQGGCRTLSGTSVASPVVAGAVALLASTVPEPQRWSVLNPASMKQALVEATDRLPRLNIFEQGSGKINLLRSMEVLKGYQPRASVIPAQLDLTDPYLWPYSRQPLYAGALPVVFNATVLNALGVTGRFEGPPQFYAADEGGRLLHISFEHSEVLWPWSGYLGLFIRVRQAGSEYSGIATGNVVFTIMSPPAEGETQPRSSTVVMPIKVLIEPPPPRHKRILWDQFHSIKYPPGYIPRDNLDIKHDILDWHGDHLFTNYQGLYNALKDKGYYVEVLSSPATCFNASAYAALLIVDPEEEFYASEVSKLARDVQEGGLNLVVFADWYHVESMLQMKFFDDNTRSWWTPVTGGANVPALNDLLAPFNISLGDSIIHGSVTLAGHRLQVSHGADIATAPAGSWVYRSGGLSSMSGRTADEQYAYLSVTPVGGTGGHVAVFADSNCLDSSHQVVPCYDFLHQLLTRLSTGVENGLCAKAERQAKPWAKTPHTPPLRRADINFTDFSFVLQHEHRCYGASHCEMADERLGGHCSDYLRTEARSSTMKKALWSTTNVAIQYPEGSRNGSSTSLRPQAVHTRRNESSLFSQVVGRTRLGISSTSLQLVTAICVAGLIAMVVIWQTGRAKAREKARRTAAATFP